MSDEYILDDVVETFSDEDTLMSDIRNNPVKWLLSLAVIAPGMAYTVTEETSYASALENWGLPTGLEWILAVFVTGQLLIAPWGQRSGIIKNQERVSQGPQGSRGDPYHLQKDY